ncbi:hypothetical protein CSV69_04650 [Sporosarcina sp. P26b]|uniref:hypothetical protein n=1 Tax=Sporosarcina sp. P26b TaxID=2048253 RepID=UPI000C16B737|nr:hypothetical protein [Sporosarcina sp. P26b]PIC96811.1 hypothetical protein CSV69_04650 [Sporosarcina sp. P26b]
MTNSTNEHVLAQCKDPDGISPIRREAWELQQALPSTSKNQAIPNSNAGPSPHAYSWPLPQAGVPTFMAPVIWFYPYCPRCYSCRNPKFHQPMPY